MAGIVERLIEIFEPGVVGTLETLFGATLVGTSGGFNEVVYIGTSHLVA
jgi:hypothetical protein